MVGGHGCEAAAADLRDARPLRLHAPPRLRVVGRGDHLLLAQSHLQRDGALPRLRQHVSRSEAKPDLAAETEAVEPARGEHDRVQPALPALPQARLHVPAQRLDRQARLEREQLRPPPHRRRPDPHPRPQLGRAAQRVPRVVSRQVRADGKTVRVRGRHVLRGVHGNVDPPAKQRLLDLLDEDAAGADLAERPRTVAVANGRDRHQRDLHARPPQPLGSELGLGEREPTAARADPEQHGRRRAPAGSGRTRRSLAGGCERRPSAPGSEAAGRSAGAR